MRGLSDQDIVIVIVPLYYEKKPRVPSNGIPIQMTATKQVTVRQGQAATPPSPR